MPVSYTQITLCVGLLVYFQNHFFRGGLCDESLFGFFYIVSVSLCVQRVAVALVAFLSILQ